MTYIFNLIITDKELLYENHKENFNIGYFSEYEKAVEVGKKYLNEVHGFKDYPCEYRIIRKNVIDSQDNKEPKEIYIICGWNINNKYDEIDIIESDCFVVYENALKAFDNMKDKYIRTEWSLDKYILNECQWTEGFIRV